MTENAVSIGARRHRGGVLRSAIPSAAGSRSIRIIHCRPTLSFPECCRTCNDSIHPSDALVQREAEIREGNCQGC